MHCHGTEASLREYASIVPPHGHSRFLEFCLLANSQQCATRGGLRIMGCHGSNAIEISRLNTVSQGLGRRVTRVHGIV